MVLNIQSCKKRFHNYKHKITYYGTYFGYPHCCIQSFFECVNQGEKPSDYLKSAGQGTGFIPCERHAELILSKKINIEDCICNRQCETPFLKERDLPKRIGD